MTVLSQLFTDFRNWFNPLPRFWAEPGVKYSYEKYGRLENFERHPDRLRLQQDFESTIGFLKDFVLNANGDCRAVAYLAAFSKQAFDAKCETYKTALYTRGIEALRELVTLSKNENISQEFRLFEIEELAHGLATCFSDDMGKIKKIEASVRTLWKKVNAFESRSADIDKLPSYRRIELEMKIVKFGSSADFLAFNRHKAEKKWRLDIRTNEMAAQFLDAAAKRNDSKTFAACADTFAKEQSNDGLIDKAHKKQRKGLLKMPSQVATEFRQAMFCGSIAEINIIGNKLLAAGSTFIWSAEEIETVLGRTEENTRSALEMALFNGKADAVRAFGEILMAAHKRGILDQRHIFKLLSLRITTTTRRNADLETYNAYQKILDAVTPILDPNEAYKVQRCVTPEEQEIPFLRLRAIRASRCEHTIGTMTYSDQIRMAYAAAAHGTQQDLLAVFANGLPQQALLKTVGRGSNSCSALEHIASGILDNQNRKGVAKIVLFFGRKRNVPLLREMIASLQALKHRSLKQRSAPQRNTENNAENVSSAKPLNAPLAMQAHQERLSAKRQSVRRLARRDGDAPNLAPSFAPISRLLAEYERPILPLKTGRSNVQIYGKPSVPLNPRH